jgi:signal transduction histidine kinase/ActR/RegA family two-component response regulator
MRSFLRRHLVWALVLAFGLTLTWAACAYCVQEAKRIHADRFMVLAEKVRAGVEKRTNLFVYGLRGARGLFTGGESVSRSRFAQYAESRDFSREFPGALGFGFIARVAGEDLGVFEARERASRSAGFDVHTLPGMAGVGKDRYVITYIEPEASNAAAIGLDITCEPIRAEAARRSMATGEPALSGPVQLIQDAERRVGFLYMLGVYRPGMPTGTPAERTAALVGWMHAPILMERVLADLPELVDGQVDLQVHDPEASDSVLFASARSSSELGGYHAELPVRLGGRTWHLEVRSTPGFDVIPEMQTVTVAHAAGVALSVLLALLCGNLVSLRERAATIARRMTSELRESNDRLRQQSGELAEAQEKAERATEAKGEFLASMSHEIRTPLTAIMGYVDLLHEEDGSMDPVERRQRLEVVRANSRHLLALINDILDLSKIEAGAMRVERTECSPAHVVAEVMSLMRVRAAEKRLALDARFLTPVPQRVTTDPTRLRQILLNLVGNAVKFTDHGGVRLEVSLHTPDLTPAEGLLVFQVHDTGCGMTGEQLGRLFRPFTQAEASTTRRFGGTGLGLAISRRLAELLGGTIDVRSHPGVGSTFTLTIRTGPIAGVGLATTLAEGIMGEDAGDRARGRGEAAPTERLRGRILLADDGEDNRRLIGHHLRKAGADVAVVENGRQALDAALEARRLGMAFGVVLLDMQMPEMDGYEAARELRARGYDLPLIALTASAMAEDRAKCLGAGCDDYATKPIDRSVLLRTCAEWLERAAELSPPGRWAA